MASREAIAGTLKFMHELYPQRAITKTTAEAWSLAFADWPDDALQAAAMQAATTPGRTFFPTPGEIAAFRKVTTIVDAAQTIRRIEKLGANVPGAGYIAPQVWRVREALGDVIADAYATAGGPGRVFSDDEVSRSIASREFQKAASEYAAMPTVERPILEAGSNSRRIAARNAPPEGLAEIIARTQKSLGAGA